MLKKNKLSVLLVAIVMMLTVYYVNINQNGPDDTLPTSGDFIDDSDERDPELAAARIQIQESRDEQIEQLQTIISTSASSIDDKRSSFLLMNTISELQIKEIAFEDFLINMGYSDALVHVIGDTVDITIISSETSVESANEIFVTAKIEFGNQCVVNLLVITD